MKQLHLSILLFSFFIFRSIISQAQVNLPYTLTFSSDDPVDWTDGIAEDGEGGSADINGLNLQIYTAGTDHTTLYPGSTIFWEDNNYFSSSTADYNGITSGPNETVTDNGVPAMVIKSANSAINFSLKSIQLYDWGYPNVITIQTYNNGTLVGSVDFTPNPDWYAVTVSQSDLLTPAYFNNIDEIRFFSKTYSIFNLSMNNISLGGGSVLPVTFTRITATGQARGHVAIEWKVENQEGIIKYEIERSADGQSFSSIGSQNINVNNGSAATYNWLDENTLQGNSFYRVKSTGINGKMEYSRIVKVYMGQTKPALAVYPNPVKGGIVHLQMNDMPTGIYKARLINSAGQIKMVKVIKHSAGNNDETLNLTSLSKGVYQLEVNNPDGSKSSTTVIY